MANEFIHIEIPVKDFEKAKKFYSGVFDWKVEILPPEMNYALFSAPKGPGGGFTKVKEKAKPGGIVNYILVNSIETTLTKIEE
ncbi:hypothetical protein IIA15_00735, partial [candidate division TA06 bacterium]|nr:hypothetical protein [candidate division TA06 bacterium]